MLLLGAMAVMSLIAFVAMGADKLKKQSSARGASRSAFCSVWPFSWVRRALTRG